MRDDQDLDALLTEAGARWRGSHAEPPLVDLVAVPQHPRRGVWLAAAAATVAVAVAVPLAVSATRNGGSPPVAVPTGSSSPAPGPTATGAPSVGPTIGPPAADVGGPRWIFDVAGPLVEVRDARTGRREAATTVGGTPYGIAVAPGTSTAYVVTAGTRCSTRVTSVAYSDSGASTLVTGGTVATVAGGRGDSPTTTMAVSPDGRRIAVAVATKGNNCRGPQDLVVIDLRTGAQRRWVGYRDVSFVGALHWSPDGRRLAYTVAPCCGGGSDGTRVLDTSAAGSSYLSPHVVLPQYEPGNPGVAYGDVLWWHGNLVVADRGSLRRVSAAGALGAVVVTGLFNDGPANVVDPGTPGDHVLLPGPVGPGESLYRWDDGRLSRLPVAVPSNAFGFAW